jgi:hypothetical protein
MMWFDKHNPNAIFADRRKENHILCDGRVLEINPDMVFDFTKIPFADNTFSLVVFDPPHLVKLGENSWMAKKYGKLFSGWEEQIKAGFDECMRVLKPNGTLIFKWNESQISVNRIIEIIGVTPLFGHPSGKHGQTIWMTFLKEEHKRFDECLLDEDWHKGECCCNCANHIEDFHHCCVDGQPDGKCVCSEHKGWICISDPLRAQSGWSKHGFCELWTKKL